MRTRIEVPTTAFVTPHSDDFTKWRVTGEALLEQLVVAGGGATMHDSHDRDARIYKLSGPAEQVRPVVAHLMALVHGDVRSKFRL